MTYQPNHHGLLDLYQCDASILQDECRLKTLLTQAAQQIGATIITSHFHTFGGAGGVTGVLLLAESHITIHTWPEHQFAAIDAFICGNMKLETLRQFLQTGLCAQHSQWQVHQRGQGLPLSDAV